MTGSGGAPGERFWAGFSCGIAALLAFLQLLLGLLVMPGLGEMLREVGAVPLVSRMVTTRTWSVVAATAVVPAVVLVARTGAMNLRTRRAAVVVVPVTALLLLAFTIGAAYLPLFQLAAKIRAE